MLLIEFWRSLIHLLFFILRPSSKVLQLTYMLLEIQLYLARKEIESLKPKASLCSLSGSNYEKQVHSIVSKCMLFGNKFNNQKDYELGGSSCKNDIECEYNGKFGIEIKKHKTPDWMQCSIKYNKKWIPTGGRNPKECYKIFSDISVHY